MNVMNQMQDPYMEGDTMHFFKVCTSFKDNPRIN